MTEPNTKGDTASLGTLVDDWGGFEKLVAQLNETGDVTVAHNVVLTGRSGAPRQIDVVIRHRQGLVEHLTVVECKYRGQAIERQNVDAFATTVREVGASRGVMFSTRGFQSGAITQARHDSIDLFQVREPTDEEWGSPGRVVDITIQVIGISIGQVVSSRVLALDGSSNPVFLNLQLGYPEGEAKTTPLLNRTDSANLESMIEKGARDGAPKLIQAGRFVGENLTYDMDVKWRSNVLINFEPPLVANCDGRILMFENVELEVGVQMTQKRLLLDRAENFTFALAVEDCVRGVVHGATRPKQATTTEIVPLSRAENVDNEDLYQNGSILKVLMAGFVDFREFMGMQRGTMIARPSAEV